ncbi:DUF58 domain-containing protein [Phycicoccus duodecadis]|uniref:Uncharacterized protein (DUF58 family) n=1 Tax=Phycicoccus duodecadis TaxID=173053 RepID=A0A2N3YMK7_9MICO|nr:DUF58 domain-containing protein [Phycicoccus duodecadis]PKW28038.1 uncharacterized protein (DUF58 family) [Phycicoccus duodecadis]
MNGGWRPTRAFGRAAAVGLALLVIGTGLRRGDVAVLGVPLLGVALWSVLTAPRTAPTARSRLEGGPVHEGESLTWRVDVEPVAGLREVLAHLPADRWTETTPAHGHVVGTARGDGTAVPVAVGVRPARWGVRRMGPAQVAAVGDLGSFVWSWPEQHTETLVVVPRPGDFTSRAALPHPVGLVGQHRSTRPGGGTELADIRPFRTGDRLRRIHWPVSLRTGALHVTTTYADEDAEVQVVVDAVRDLGHRDVARGRLTSLDVAVEAAGAVAAHYLSTGDRVGLSVLGGGGLVEVPAVGGHHQLARVLVGLGRAEPARGTLAEERLLQAQLARAVSPGAVVVLLSGLVSVGPLGQAVRLARSGHVVLVVDTLPAALAGTGVSAEDAMAATGIGDPRLARLVWRLRLLDREREVRRCAAAGVPVVPWQGAGSLDAVLRGLGRRRRSTAVGR